MVREDDLVVKGEFSRLVSDRRGEGYASVVLFGED